MLNSAESKWTQDREEGIEVRLENAKKEWEIERGREKAEMRSVFQKVSVNKTFK